MVQGGDLGASPRRGRSVAAAGVSLVAVFVLVAVVSMVGTAQGPVELDREAQEIAQLQSEKKALQSRLSMGLKAPKEELSPKAPARKIQLSEVHRTAARKAVSVKQLEAKKMALEARLEKYARDSKQDPVVAGVLGTFKVDSGDGLLSHVKDTHEDVSALPPTNCPADQP
ncbi:hypothetical protein T484DRAFT_1752209 [Baffinella frigidus]|nr:hypothetical protein T484DRAFT_1752209 [Cryptophyta sp. CCMP2293]